MSGMITSNPPDTKWATQRDSRGTVGQPSAAEPVLTRRPRPGGGGAPADTVGLITTTLTQARPGGGAHPTAPGGLLLNGSGPTIWPPPQPRTAIIPKQTPRTRHSHSAATHNCGQPVGEINRLPPLSVTCRDGGPPARPAAWRQGSTETTSADAAGGRGMVACGTRSCSTFNPERET